MYIGTFPQLHVVRVFGTWYTCTTMYIHGFQHVDWYTMNGLLWHECQYFSFINTFAMHVYVSSVGK